MPKKNMSEEERKAWGEKMKQARLAKQAEQPQAVPNTESTSAGADTGDTDEETTTVQQGNDPDRIARLEAQIEMLVKLQGGQSNQNAPATTHEKYSTQLSIYESPVEKLLEWAQTNPKMKQQAFSANFELQYVAEVPPRYQLADKSWERQPKFTLGLLEKAYDDDGNQLTRVNERGETVDIKYLRKRLVFFEDPDNALAIAHRKGLQLDDQSSQAFLNDMRFIQAQEWLLDVFYPPKPDAGNGFREEAIAGQMVTIVESPALMSKIDSDHKLRV